MAGRDDTARDDTARDDTDTARDDTAPDDASRDDGDRGAVTVEAALALCSLVLVLALALSGLSAVGAQLRCQDAAREAARLVTRGEPERARQVAASIAPEGARVDVRISGDEVTVGVAGPAVRLLPGLVVSARAVGVLEPGVLPGAGDDPAAGGPVDGASAPDRPEEPPADADPGGLPDPGPAAPGDSP